MITKFSVLYVGQIELDNVGLDGTPADAAALPERAADRGVPTSKATSPSSWTSSATTASGRPSTTSSSEGYEVLPEPRSCSRTWLATQTRRLKLGCAFNILPMWHPIRLAEDYAMADIVTDGRVIMGVGRGYHTREVESFGAPAPRRGGEPGAVRGADGGAAQVLQRGVAGATAASTTRSRPTWSTAATSCARSPACRARSTGRSRSGADRERQDASTTWPSTDLKAHGDAQRREDHSTRSSQAYRDACARHGRPQARSARTSAGASGLYLADTREEAIRRVEPAHDERYKWFAPFGFVRYADEQGRSWGTPGAPARVPTLREGVEQKAWLVRPPGRRDRDDPRDRGPVPGARPDA